MIDEDALRAKWGVKPEELAEKKRIEKGREGLPTPAKVTVEETDEPLRDISPWDPPAGKRWFFVGHGEDGSQWPIMNTTHPGLCKKEVDLWQSRGVPVLRAKRSRD